MSLTGPQTTPLEPAYAQPRGVITPGRDLMLALTAHCSSVPLGSFGLTCLLRSLRALAG